MINRFNLILPTCLVNPHVFFLFLLVVYSIYHFHLGKTSVEADGFLFNLLRDPQVPQDGPPIKPFDADVLREAYSLKPGPIPGVSAIGLGSLS